MFELNIPAIMLRRLLLFTLSLAAFAATAQITVEQCVDLARENYPLIQKYDLLRQTRSIDLSDINKTWLPQLNAYGQATVQNAVPSFPTALSDIMDRMGTGIPGMEKVQYKVGVDVGQTIWDGGMSKSRREVEEAIHAERTAALDVQLYAVRERVENLFFSILLLEEQTAQARLTQTLLESNLAMLRAMKANGTAMQSDVDMLEAQYLSVGQQITQTESAALTYRTLLGLYTGKDMTATPLVKPQPVMPDTLTPARPELNLFAAQTQSNDAHSGNIRADVMPRIGLFAQAYYGYPGFNYFENMMNRDLSFNILAGVKITWNISSFYTKKNNLQKLRVANGNIQADREVFLFNTRLQTQSQSARITELEEIIKDDARIVALRTNVRRAAESQLRNGVIDATALLTKISDENQARLTSSYHEIQLLQSIYQLKYTLNR